VSDLTIALAGGAIGSLFTASIGLARRVAAVPSEVERNDFDARERNDDLETWVIDEHHQLGLTIADRRQQAAAAGVSRGGTIPQATAKVKAISLHRYRDQERQARRDIAVIRGREDWMHRAYRRWKKLPDPQLTAPQRVQLVLNTWRKPVIVADASVAVRDPTQHTLDETIGGLTGSSP
jgi:hypothetical protein